MSNTYGVQCRVTKRKDDFIGRIEVYHEGKKLWSKSCGVHRITRDDALLDAARLLSDTLQTSGVDPEPALQALGFSSATLYAG